ncbi:MAG TPA: DUF488 family protein [Jatrophihabitans sp.]|jgi:uncharacterized protein YeaO (DUF488 family)|nr:DUF488 family protein [Jatrophihabitans sp.]
MGIALRRVYDAVETNTARVLVDRLWPRGLTKQAARVDEWCKEVAPSTELRKWYGHDPNRFAEFRRRYLAELDEPQRAQRIEHLRQLADQRPLTLLTATKDLETSAARVLLDVLTS